jgi:hypothetical protein
MGVRTRGASGSLLRDLGDLFHAHGPRLGTLPGTLQPNDHTLRDLQWLYLKLLIARQHLLAARTRPTGTVCRPTSWRSAASSVTRRFRPRPASPRPPRSRSSAAPRTWRGAGRQTLEEIASDLARIEAQVALVLENTTLEGKPQAISSDLELASQLLDGTQFAVACLGTRTGLSANGRG